MIALPIARNRSIATTPEVDAMLAAGCPVAIGVSGGKDSSAVAIATVAYLEKIGHTGPRLLIHADLGVVEWKDSLPTCRRLAERLGLELVIVRRRQGDMMERWEQRWRDNLKRYMDLSCVKLILPWSTPAMRFCTAELKVDQITRYLKKRFPGQAILNVTGIRHAESAERAKAPTAKPEPKLEGKKLKTTGWSWNPIIGWSTEDVFRFADEVSFPLHEAYRVYGSSRVSCVYCILATEGDHRAGMIPEENQAVGRRMVDLEIASTFAFQGSRWLGDTLVSILTAEQVEQLRATPERAERREKAEALIPNHLLYEKGWPNCVPTYDEAVLLAAVRFQVADAVGFEPTFTNPHQIIARYQQLMAMKDAKPKRSKKQPSCVLAA